MAVVSSPNRSIDTAEESPSNKPTLKERFDGTLTSPSTLTFFMSLRSCQGVFNQQPPGSHPTPAPSFGRIVRQPSESTIHSQPPQVCQPSVWAEASLDSSASPSAAAAASATSAETPEPASSFSTASCPGAPTPAPSAAASPSPETPPGCTPSASEPATPPVAPGPQRHRWKHPRHRPQQQRRPLLRLPSPPLAPSPAQRGTAPPQARMPSRS